MKLHHIAVIILNYNSEKDLQICVEQIAQQENIHLSIILVDNASRPESLIAVRTWLAEWRLNAVCGSEDIVQTWVREHQEKTKQSGNVYLIENHANQGYSAGNNIGIRLAEALQADAILIANPDMRIENPLYLKELVTHLFTAPDNFIASSRIIGLDGAEQNPLREAKFWEEVLWPRWVLRRIFKPSSYVLSYPKDSTSVVPKVSGCCLLLRMDFLRSTNYLDENVFLYCEEPILSAKVHAAQGKVLYVPTVSAIHAHVSSEKGDKVKRMLLFIKSRRYYLKTYSGYNRWQLFLLSCSYSAFAGYNRLKGFCRPVIDRMHWILNEK